MTQASPDSRRRFLRRAGKVALTTPPTLALLLSGEGRHYAMAASGMGSTRVERLTQREERIVALADDAKNMGLNHEGNKLDKRANRIQNEINSLEGK